jgi:pyruvate/2-oxoglutarate dehydrogenase complex dihydrolipoamide dehydrogenase (E3) component
MAQRLKADICVIGGGSGGLSTAAGAAQMGARTVLVEKARMGGDCLNFGCVPSKALLAAAKAADGIRRAGRFGVVASTPVVDFRRVHGHVHDVIAEIAPHDSQERFEGLGVTVLRAPARFTGPRTIVAGDADIEARWIVVATGSSPLVPPIPGLDAVAYLTNETVFELDSCPAHLVIVGGGPIGCELAQGFARLGAKVTVVEMARILPRDDPEAVDVVRARLAADGVRLEENAKVTGVARDASGVAVALERDGRIERLGGSHLLLAAGRRANVDGLDLEKAGIAYDRRGITVDRHLRTSNRRAFAIGDVAGGYQFTHMANYHAGIVIRNALFRLQAKADGRAVPWVTFTDPELAHVGLTEAEARQGHGEVRVLRRSFAELDRARAERATEGLIKVVVGRRGRILGATIAGAHAGELVQPWVLALSAGMKIGQVATMIAPYPTFGEIGKQAAGGYYTPSLFSERTRAIVRFLMRFA